MIPGTSRAVRVYAYPVRVCAFGLQVAASQATASQFSNQRRRKQVLSDEMFTHPAFSSRPCQGVATQAILSD